MLCESRRLFLVSGLGSGFLVTGLHSSSLRLFLFFPCSTWYKCVKLVSWSFGHFYPEFYDSSLAWTPCLCFFSLGGGSHLLPCGCASGALRMCPLASWWLWPFGYYSSSDPLSWFFALVLDRTSFVFNGLPCLRFYLYTFSDLCLFLSRYFMVMWRS